MSEESRQGVNAHDHDSVSHDEHFFIAVHGLAFTTIVVTTLVLGLMIKKRRFYYLPESGATMMLGFFIGGVVSLAGEAEAAALVFNPYVFFFALLPPIIFEAGYTLKRKEFFRNIGSVVMYAVPGTLISTMVFGYMMWGFASLGLCPLDTDDALEALLFGALISATDPVATLALLGAPEVAADPLLYSLVFGESVLNDAVAIVLYQTFLSFLSSPFSGVSLLAAIGKFVGVSLGSTCIGVGIAFICCIIFKKIDFSQYPVYEFTLICLFAYMSYFVAELLHMSGIMSLFFCAIALAHWNESNISHESHHATHHAFKSVAQICETFVFAYIGITAGLSASPLVYNLDWSPSLILFTLLSIFIARAANIFPLSFVLNQYRALKIPAKMQFPMWFGGLRGAVAFALCLDVPTKNGNYMITTTLSVVIFTTLVCGGSTYPVLKCSNVTGTDLQAEYDAKHADADGITVNSGQHTFMNRFGAWFVRFDNDHLKRIFSSGREIHNNASLDKLEEHSQIRKQKAAHAGSTAGSDHSAEHQQQHQHEHHHDRQHEADVEMAPHEHDPAKNADVGEGADSKWKPVE